MAVAWTSVAENVVNSPSSLTTELTVNVLSGEGLFIHTLNTGPTAVSVPTSCVFDPAGVNQAMTLVRSVIMQTGGGGDEGKRFSLYQLPSPGATGSKIVRVTQADTVPVNCVVSCRHVTGHETAGSMVRNVADDWEPSALSVPMAIGVASQAGDTVGIFCSIRDGAANYNAGDLSDYQEYDFVNVYAMLSGTRAGASGTVTGTFGIGAGTPGANYANAQIAVSIIPAASGGSASLPPIASIHFRQRRA